MPGMRPEGLVKGQQGTKGKGLDCRLKGFNEMRNHGLEEITVFSGESGLTIVLPRSGLDPVKMGSKIMKTHMTEAHPKTCIPLTGATLTKPQMAEWWASGKVEYLALPSWELFVKKWDTLVGDYVAHSGHSSAHISYTSSTSIPLPTSLTGNATSPSSLVTPPKFLPIMEEEKAALTAV
ncbi:hypothetical protein BU17DRAFT_65672 [Hysterangium stoloniferum]|nr:hypothetical protein BU17DRAFT_65672 [Hysterangium stoloniferum]